MDYLYVDVFVTVVRIPRLSHVINSGRGCGRNSTSFVPVKNSEQCGLVSFNVALVLLELLFFTYL